MSEKKETNRVCPVRVREAYEKTRVTPRPRIWTDLSPVQGYEACALGVLKIQASGARIWESSEVRNFAQEELGLSSDYIAGFTTGFDGIGPSKHPSFGKDYFLGHEDGRRAFEEVFCDTKTGPSDT